MSKLYEQVSEYWAPKPKSRQSLDAAAAADEEPGNEGSAANDEEAKDQALDDGLEDLGEAAAENSDEELMLALELGLAAAGDAEPDEPSIKTDEFAAIKVESPHKVRKPVDGGCTSPPVTASKPPILIEVGDSPLPEAPNPRKRSREECLERLQLLQYLCWQVK